MVEPLRHRQTKGAANRHARPTATAPHSYSTPLADDVRRRNGDQVTGLPLCPRTKPLFHRHPGRVGIVFRHRGAERGVFAPKFFWYTIPFSPQMKVSTPLSP